MAAGNVVVDTGDLTDVVMENADIGAMLAHDTGADYRNKENMEVDTNRNIVDYHDAA